MHSCRKRARSYIQFASLAFLAILGPPMTFWAGGLLEAQDQITASARHLFARENLVAWCIVPFDSKKRSPEDRAAMLARLGFKRFAYDWRAEHIPSFDAEMDALEQKGIKLDAFWVAPGELNRESRIILDLLERHGLKTDLWVLLDLGADRVDRPRTGKTDRRSS